jgi:hypothetical protein
VMNGPNAFGSPPRAPEVGTNVLSITTNEPAQGATTPASPEGTNSVTTPR